MYICCWSGAHHFDARPTDGIALLMCVYCITKASISFLCHQILCFYFIYTYNEELCWINPAIATCHILPYTICMYSMFNVFPPPLKHAKPSIISTHYVYIWSGSTTKVCVTFDSDACACYLSRRVIYTLVQPLSATS